jgi:hypothetical protein
MCSIEERDYRWRHIWRLIIGEANVHVMYMDASCLEQRTTAEKTVDARKLAR